MHANELITNGVPDLGKCPWNSILFITHRVLPGMRWDKVLTIEQALMLDLTPIFNQFKRNWLTKGYLFRNHIAEWKEPGYVDWTKRSENGTFDGWIVSPHKKYRNRETNQMVGPYDDGFMVGSRLIKIHTSDDEDDKERTFDLLNVSIAIVTTR